MIFDSSEFRKIAMQGQKLDGEYIVDAHTHIGGPGRASHIPKSSTDEIITEMDRLGVSRALTVPTYGATSDFVIGNDIAAEAVAKYPDRFVGFAAVNPHYHSEIDAELDRCRDMGLRGLRLITDYPAYPVESASFFTAYEYAHNHGWIMDHYGWGAAQFLDNVATAFSNACFIVGHYTLAYAELVAKRDNIFQSTCGAVHFADIKNLLDVVPAEKVVFGSGFPEMPTMFSMGPILYADISDDDKRKILGLTAKSILETWPGK
jgi:uncharacterized protein